MSFLIPNYISRDLPLTLLQRRRIRIEAWKLWMKDWRNVLVYLAAVTIVLGGAAIVGVVMGLLVQGVGHWILWLAAYTAVTHLVFALLRSYRFAPLVQQVLRREGYEACMKCGYWFRGLPTDVEVCPECGAPREPVHYKERATDADVARGDTSQLPLSGFSQWT